MDAAKPIALAVANQKPPRELVGYFKGWRAPLPLYAVPTTAGTGSEVTVAAVVSDPEHHRKLVIADTRLVPRMALSAVGMIYEALPIAHAHGQDLAACEKMALAANYAGQAFTPANVGYVHAIAHQLGGLYHTPHGLANAIMLPHVLRFLSPAIRPQLAVLGLRAKVGKKNDPEAVLAQKFLASIDAMNTRLGIPTTLEALRDDDVAALARAACHEADANYPVPMYLSQPECEAVIRKVLPAHATSKPKACNTAARRKPKAARV